MRTVWNFSFFLLFTVITFAAGKQTDPFFHVNLSQYANMDYIDQKANDGKGGWFDDAESDLRFFPVYRLSGKPVPENIVLDGIPYRLLNPAKNNGKAIVVFGSERKPLIRCRAAGPFSVNRKAEFIILLHATGWGRAKMKVAELKIFYADGTTAVVDIINGKNVSDWFDPVKVPEAKLVWKGGTMLTYPGGLYAAEIRNPFPAKKIKTITFQGGFDNVMYALCAVTLTDGTRLPDSMNLKPQPRLLAKRPPLKPGELNPLRFVSYEQGLEAVFSSEHDAETARLEVLSLPYGKKYAFTLRWDDCNPNHLNQAKLMRKHGLRGTFMITNFGKYYLKTARALKDYGFTFGNHSWKHIRYSKLSHNVIFEMILREQVTIESELDTVCVSYVFPGGIGDLHGSKAHTAGRAMNAAGIFSGPFMSVSTGKTIGLNSRRMFLTYLFSANDRTPKEDLFTNGMYSAKVLSMLDPDIPRITFGLHNWMNPENMKVLDRIYYRHAHSDDFWYADENEYAAYRYSFYNAEPIRKKQNGKHVSFTIRRFDPASLGAETPLEITFTKRPKELRLNGKKLLPDMDGHYLLEHDQDRRLPEKVEQIGKNGISKKFPGLSAKFEVDLKNNSAKLIFSNHSGKLLKHNVFTLILPPHWVNMNQIKTISELKNGETKTMIFDLGKVEKRPGFEAETYWISCKIDFSGPQKSGRIYCVQETFYKTK